MNSVNNILIFPTCFISKVELEDEQFLVYVKDSWNVFYLKKTEENFKQITVQIQKQFEKSLDDEILRIFESILPNKCDDNSKILSLRYVLIGFKHYITLEKAVFSDIHETDLMSTEIICNDKKLCKSLRQKYYGMKRK